VSRGQSVGHMHALSSFYNNKNSSRPKAEAGIYTANIFVCSCWSRLVKNADDELSAIVTATARGECVVVNPDPDAALAEFMLPASLLPADRRPSLRNTLHRDASAEERLRGELLLTQETVHVCL